MFNPLAPGFFLRKSKFLKAMFKYDFYFSYEEI
jgi:hypothetical protein